MSEFWERLQATPALHKYASVTVFVMALAFYALTAGPTAPTGDGIHYTTLASLGMILEIPVHAGYIALAALVMRLLPGVRPDLVTQGISMVFGALGWGVETQSCWFQRTDRRAGWQGGLALLVAGEYWFHATTAEVYIVQTGSMVTAYVLWLYAKPRSHPDDTPAELETTPRSPWIAYLRFALAVLLVALAVTVSPSSVAVLPMFLFGRRLRIPWKRVLIAGAGLAGAAAVVGVGFYDALMAGREFHPSLYPALRSLAFLGAGMGLIMLATIGLLAINGLDDANPVVRRRRRLALIGVGLLLALHIPIGTFIAIGPLIPTYPFVAVAFGISMSWLRTQTSLPRRAVQRIVIGGAAALVVGALVFAGGMALRPWAWGLAVGWLERNLSPLLSAAAGAALASVAMLAIGVTRRAQERAGRVERALAGIGLALVLAQALLSLALVIQPKYEIARYQEEAINLLAARSPRPAQIVGSFTALMEYDYATLGHALWETEHVYVDELDPEQFDKLLAAEGELYLLGRYGRRYAAREGVDLDAYRLTPLDGDHDMLWLVQPGE